MHVYTRAHARTVSVVGLRLMKQICGPGLCGRSRKADCGEIGSAPSTPSSPRGGSSSPALGVERLIDEGEREFYLSCWKGRGSAVHYKLLGLWIVLIYLELRLSLQCKRYLFALIAQAVILNPEKFEREVGWIRGGVEEQMINVF